MSVVGFKLPCGRETKVDEQDIPLIVGYRWFSTPKKKGRLYVWGYKIERGANRQARVYLHRLILNAPAGMLVDHADGDGLNNSRANIRLATRSQNAANSTPANPRKYRGVAAALPSTKGKPQKYFAALSSRGKWYIGARHLTKEAAAADYNRMAREHHGEFARLNVIPDVGTT